MTSQQPGSRIDDVLTNGVKLFKVVDEFIKGCQIKAKSIIDDLCFPENVRRYKAVGSEYSSSGDNRDIPCRLVFQDESHITILSIPE